MSGRFEYTGIIIFDLDDLAPSGNTPTETNLQASQFPHPHG
jgi:hypothetical protein